MMSSAALASPEAARRARPRLFDTDWLVLRNLRREVERVAEAEVRSGTRAVDFGCGSRPYEAIFEDHGCDYLGADLSDAEIAISPEGALDAPDGSADWVLSFQVLEHVRDLDTYLGEARRVLAARGHLLLSTHGTWLYHPHPEDHRRWTRMGLTHEIESRGFELLSCTPVVGPLAWTTLTRLTCFAAGLRGIPVVGRFLAGCVAVVMNTRAVIEDKITPQWVTDDNACVYVTLSRPRAA
jgi:SAM-dependent methyltransferase